MVEVHSAGFWARHRKTAGLLATSFGGGMLYAAALPPLNLSFAVCISLLPVFYAGVNLRWKTAMCCGWFYGLGWALFAFQFLREIEWFTPYLLAPVLALWFLVWGALLPVLARWLLFPAPAVKWTAAEKNVFLRNSTSKWRILVFALASSALFTVIEWSRSRLFVWNDFSVTQWRNLPLIQIAQLTGSYGIGFLVVLSNAALFFLLFFRKRGIPAAGVTLLLLAVSLSYGFWKLHAYAAKTVKGIELRAGLIQPDLSQRRHSTRQEALEAIEVCTELSCKVAKESLPEVIIWPECAVPVPLRSASAEGDYFRMKFSAMLKTVQIPILAGMLEFKESDGVPGHTNSALFFTPQRLAGRYDKIHRVPYGEYVPFRKFLPEFIIDAVDMGRDLVPGDTMEPIEIKPGVRASVAICYEGVFGYLMRQLAAQGSNCFIVISNDAWYPESSEPEQHLANAVIRCVETGLPMIRCGNNGGSGAVSPVGSFHSYIGSSADRPELLRERACGVVKINVDPEIKPTFFVRYGDWFIWVLAAGLLAVAAFGAKVEYDRCAADVK